MILIKDNSLNNLVFRIIKRTIIISLIVIGICAIFFKEPKTIITGYIFGVLIAILSFKLLDNSTRKAVMMTEKRAAAYSSSQYFVRFSIHFIVLAIAAQADYLNFASTVVGLLMIKFVILSATIFNKSFLR